MAQTIAVPLWLLVLLAMLSIAGLLQWALLPGMRWYFRRKVRKVIDEISVRLNIELPQFKLTRRRALAPGHATALHGAKPMQSGQRPPCFRRERCGETC